MPGTKFGGTEGIAYPTPGRKTHVWFDLNHSFISEPSFQFSRPAKAMFLQDAIANKNLVHYADGWQIMAYHEDSTIVAERSEIPNATFLSPTNGNLTVAPGFEGALLYKAPDNITEMPGATTGASANLKQTGLPGVRKVVAAGTTWSTLNLSSDQTSYPFDGVSSSYGIDTTIKLDRVAISHENDSAEKDIHLQVLTYGGQQDSSHELWRFYFNAPAGRDSNGIGNGQYCLVALGNNLCVLFEKCPLSSPKWVRRFEFVGAVGGFTGGRTSLSILKSQQCENIKNGTNGYITFVFASIPGFDDGQVLSSNSILASITANVDAIRPANGNGQFKRVQYKVIGPKAGTSNAPLRLDLRRDLLGAFVISWHTYPTQELEVSDSPFEMPFPPSTEEDMHLVWRDCVPTSCLIDLTLHNAETGAELVSVSNVGNHKIYETPELVRRYFIKATFQSNGSFTPALYNYTILRGGVLRNPGLPSWEIGDASHPKSVLRGIGIIGPERDLAQEQATIELADPLDSLSELKLRSGMPMRIETEYDSSDTSKRVIIFRGFVDDAEATRQKTADKEKKYPKTGWNTFSVKCKGIWQQIKEQFIGSPVYTLTDPETGIPRKVTDILKEIISNTGFDINTQFTHWPDLPIRVYATDIDFSQGIDMLEKSADVIKSMARDYLSQHLIFDPQLDSEGQWLLVDPPTSPYTNKCEFVFNPDDIAEKALVSFLPAYAQTDPIQVPCDQVKTKVLKPEANFLTVTSIGAWNSQAPSVYTVMMFNPVSFDFLGDATSDPTSPDYLGRILPLYVIDPAIGSAVNEQTLKAATNALCRRIAKLTFHGIKLCTLHAPLVLIEHELDPTTKRKLRFYDPVLVNGVQFLVRSVNPSYEKDGIQYAMYELEAPRF